MNISSLVEGVVRAKLEEAVDYDTAKKRVQRMKKGAQVTFTNSKGVDVTGEYKGLMNRGGRSYAKVEGGKEHGMTLVPVTQIHQAMNESKDAEAKHRAHLAKATKAMNQISKKLKEHEKAGDVNWAHVGTLSKVAGDLEEIARFLG